MGQPSEFYSCGTRQRPASTRTHWALCWVELLSHLKPRFSTALQIAAVKPSGQPGQNNWYTVSSYMRVWVYGYVWVCLLLYRLQSNTNLAAIPPIANTHTICSLLWPEWAIVGEGAEEIRAPKGTHTVWSRSRLQFGGTSTTVPESNTRVFKERATHAVISSVRSRSCSRCQGSNTAQGTIHLRVYKKKRHK